MNQSIPFLQQVLDGIQQALLTGQAALQGSMAQWFAYFALAQLLWVVIQSFATRRLLGASWVLVLRTGMVWWLCQEYPTVLQGMLEYMVHLGSLAANNVLPSSQFLDPGAYLAYARTTAQPLHDLVTSSWSLLNPTVALGMLGLYVGFLAAFALCAANVFVWQLETLVTGSFFVILLPALAFRGSAWVAQGALSYLINASTRLGLLALLSSLIFPIVQQLLTFPARPGFGDMVLIVVQVWSVCLALLYVNKLASSMLAGMASLGAGHLVAAAGTAAVAAGGLVSGLVGGGAVLGAGGLTAARGALALGGGARGLLTAGSTQMLGGGMGGVVGRLGAAVQGARQVTAAPLSQRLGSYAGASGRLALTQGRQATQRGFDTARFVGHMTH